MTCDCKCHTSTTYHRDHDLYSCWRWCYGLPSLEDASTKKEG